MLRRHRFVLSIIVVLGIASSLAESAGIVLFIPLFHELTRSAARGSQVSAVAQFVDGLFAHVADDQRLMVICAFIFCAIVVKAALVFSYGVAFQWLVARTGHELRRAVFGQLLNVNYAFVARSRSGSHVNTMTREVSRTGEAIGHLVYFVILASIGGVLALMLLILSWKLTAVVAGAFVAISLVLRVPLRRIRTFGRLQRRVNADLGQHMVEALDGMRVIRDFGRAAHEQRRFDRVSRRAADTVFRMGILSRTAAPIYDVLVMALLVAILFVSAQNPATLPSLVVFILLLYRLQPILKAMTTSRIELLACAAAVEHVTSLLDERDKPHVRAGTEPGGPLRDAIEFRDVTFRYDGADRPSLSNATFRIAAGQTTALVGRSSAGKSTVTNLILRLYDPTKGQIVVDGRPLEILDAAKWRDRIAVVRQDVFLFNTSVLSNIAYGRLDATREDVIEAAKLAHAHDFIMSLPKGYDTIVGARGVQLSGGERQRLTLARAIIRDPEILILDEATNALDSISEQIIQDALDQFGRSRTIIIAAHRSKAIERADHAIVLENGRVTEQGTPAQLRKTRGLFARLHDKVETLGSDAGGETLAS